MKMHLSLPSPGVLGTAATGLLVISVLSGSACRPSGTPEDGPPTQEKVAVIGSAFDIQTLNELIDPGTGVVGHGVRLLSQPPPLWLQRQRLLASRPTDIAWLPATA